MDGITVTVTSKTTTTNVLGDGTTTTSSTTIAGVMYAPRGSQEATNNDSPRVYTAASLYFADGLPSGVLLDSNDTITIATTDPLIDGTYQVDGIPGYWGGPVEVAISRTGGV